MSVAEFFQYLLDRESTRELSLELAAVYTVRRVRRAASAAR
jgi:hypothetical protein